MLGYRIRLLTSGPISMVLSAHLLEAQLLGSEFTMLDRRDKQPVPQRNQQRLLQGLLLLRNEVLRLQSVMSRLLLQSSISIRKRQGRKRRTKLAVMTTVTTAVRALS